MTEIHRLNGALSALNVFLKLVQCIFVAGMPKSPLLARKGTLRFGYHSL
jgi:hypothetical protein